MFDYVTISADPPVVLKPGFKVRFDKTPDVAEGQLVRAEAGFVVVAKSLKLGKGVHFQSERDMTLDYYDLLALAEDPRTGLWARRLARKNGTLRDLVDAAAARQPRPARGSPGTGGRGFRAAAKKAAAKVASLV